MPVPNITPEPSNCQNLRAAGAEEEEDLDRDADDAGGRGGADFKLSGPTTR